MEHEFEKIRNKVLEAEQNPVAWEKELVWSKVRQPERKHFVFYYAAASLLIASAISFYAFENTKQKEIELQLKVIELSIEENKTSQETLAVLKSTQKSIACEETSTPPVVRSASGNTEKKKNTKAVPLLSDTPPILTTQEKKEETNIVTIAQEMPTQLPPESQTIVVAKTGGVKTIIGGGEPDVVSSSQERKLQFKFFKSDEQPIINSTVEPISLLSKSNRK